MVIDQPGDARRRCGSPCMVTSIPGEIFLNTRYLERVFKRTCRMESRNMQEPPTSIARLVCDSIHVGNVLTAA